MSDFISIFEIQVCSHTKAGMSRTIPFMFRKAAQVSRKENLLACWHDRMTFHAYNGYGINRPDYRGSRSEG